jgi:hypothetical protein
MRIAEDLILLMHQHIVLLNDVESALKIRRAAKLSGDNKLVLEMNEGLRLFREEMVRVEKRLKAMGWHRMPYGYSRSSTAKLNEADKAARP